MLLSRLYVSALLIGVLAGCGFRPLYATYKDGSVATELEQVYIAAIPDRLGQQVRNELLDRINPRGEPGDPAYRLEIRLTSVNPPTVLSTTNLASRRNVRVTARYTLRSADGKQRLDNGYYRATASYNIIDSEYATLAAFENAQDQVVVQIADEIKNRIAIYLASMR